MPNYCELSWSSSHIIEVIAVESLVFIALLKALYSLRCWKPCIHCAVESLVFIALLKALYSLRCWKPCIHCVVESLVFIALLKALYSLRCWKPFIHCALRDNIGKHMRMTQWADNGMYWTVMKCFLHFWPN